MNEIEPRDTELEAVSQLAAQKQKVKFVAAVLGVDVEQLGMDVYAICAHMEAEGNPGIHLYNLVARNSREDVTLPVYWMNPDVLGDALEGICFFSQASQRSDFSGWYVKRRPEVGTGDEAVMAWRIKWLELFDLDNETATAVREAIQKAGAKERAKPKRAHNYTGLEEVPTIEIAHRWEAAKLLDDWFFRLLLATHQSTARNLWSWMRTVLSQAARVMRQELEYRTEAEPEPRRSKKKTEAALKDFREAALWLGGVNKVYSEEFKRAVVEAAFPFNLAGVDYERLPEPVASEKPIRFMTDGELVKDFMRFMAEDFDEDSFEYEDRKLLMDNLRKQYARIKGQRAGSDGDTPSSRRVA